MNTELNPATLDAAGIAARVPHAGRMCLLTALHGWDASTIHCSASGHDAADHPLHEPTLGGVPAAAAIEYASQAMALHGSLSAPPGTPPKPGFLAAVRGVVCHTATLSGAAGPLQVRAERLLGDGQQAQYRFSVADVHGQPLVEGRATVVLNAVPGAPRGA